MLVVYFLYNGWTMKSFPLELVKLEKIVGGGQTLGTLADGRKVFVWGGLPGETVEARLTKLKSKLAEGVVTDVIEPSPERAAPVDPESYLSTSPWQIMHFTSEQQYKAKLVDEAFELHKVVLPNKTDIFTDNVQLAYRNKVEFSWYGSSPQDSEDETPDTLDLAFFRRGTKGKIVVTGTSLAREEITILARQIRNLLQAKNVSARQLKTLLIRSDQKGNCVWQLYVKDNLVDVISQTEAAEFSAQGGEVIYSDPRSPASRITKRLAAFGDIVLTDTILDVPFRYATEGFFQVNIPVYEQALCDMREYSVCTTTGEVETKDGMKEIAPSDGARKSEETAAARASADAYSTEARREAVSDDFVSNGATSILDLYSGVGTIGLTIGGDDVTLVEINEDAVREMKRNIQSLHKNAHAVLAPSEKALDYITSDKIIVVDPPRAGLHPDVIGRLLETLPRRIIYLSCNPVTQARDTALLLEKYRIVHHRGYNFFPRTPHIEHLVVLDKL